MHPAASIVVFTTLSGAGYGLMFWFGLGAALGVLPPDRGFAAASLGLALAAVTAGLLSSVFHLGRRERAWRAFSQWRSSWLSREGVAALATYPPALLFAWGAVVRGAASGIWAGFAAAAALGALATVLCTAYIYRSLKPIANWNNCWVPANFLALAGMSGASWLAAFALAFGIAERTAPALALGTMVVAALLKLGYWRHIDRGPFRATAESATGLGRLGSVRSFEAPHTAQNFLMREMGFAVARRHRDKLRRIALQLGFLIPILLTLLAVAEGGWVRLVAAFLAPLLCLSGVLVERWLFFAEAKHTVTLYYGARRA